MKTNASKQAQRQVGPLGGFRIRKALVGLEMRQTDEKLLQYTNLLCSLLPVDRIDFLHQLPSYLLFSHLFQGERQLADQQAQKKYELLSQMQREIRQHFRMSAAQEIDHEVRIGEPLAGLLQKAVELDSELVVVGQKIHAGGHGVLPRKLAGLLRSSALIVPQRAPLSLRKILIPVDFSEPSRRALETAIRLQRQLIDKPTLVCVHIYQVPDFADANKLPTLIKEDQAHQLAEFIAAYDDQITGPVETVLLERELITRTGIYLLEYALAEAIDLIILGARGLSPIERMVMGSVTERLLARNDDIPTWVIK